MISQSELTLLLRGWRDKSLSLRIVGKLSTGCFTLFCTVLECNSDAVGFTLDNKAGICELVLSGFNFEYAEARTDKAQEEIIDGSKWTAALIGLRPIGKEGEFEELIFMAAAESD